MKRNLWIIDNNTALYACSSFEVLSLCCYGTRKELVQFCGVVAIGDELEAPIVELCLLLSELCTEVNEIGTWADLPTASDL